ncbi:hybrid sensor histidine kinase/response regulator [Pelagicoccus sp. SDUM812002]|uniref:hybrid sensor histidine kinase/response regulator n=1 Tax=Pelagicoccus sp. SDUM812002 TaxID=3041266 RepID=UPI00280E1CFD|nr:hybrid sensor histidine kinase/response regulator [Pelagicoccus sp. SDUM812002]MDQ8186588.1 hybrid sensor histidine kinase/response regulator [Pelagicoccus sp. SDUM812002]
MTGQYDYKKYRVLFVDDEVQTTDLVCEYLMDTFDIVPAYNAEEAWAKFEENPDSFAVIVTDQRMPGDQGTDLLEKIRAARPRTIRILCTAYADIQAAIDAVNVGAIYKYITKPVETPELEMNVMRSMEFYLIQRERDLLMREKLSALQRLMMTDRLISLGVFAAGLNHHMRNGLTAVKTFLDLAPLKLQSENVSLDSLRNPNYWNDFYTTAQDSMQKVLDLLKEVQEIPEPPPVPDDDQVDLATVVREALERESEVFSGRSITVEFSAGEVPPIAASRGMISRLFELLLKDESANANEGGTIRISLESQDSVDGKAGVRAVLEDDGPGLTAENLQCLFDPFFTRRGQPDQYGINLLAAFFLIHHHSGSISAEKSEMGGVRFDIWLPVDPSSMPSLQGEEAFLQRVMEAERAWEKKLIGE